MKKLLLLILLFALPGTVAMGQPGEALLKIVVDEKGKMQVFDLQQDSLQKSQQGKAGAVQPNWENFQDPEIMQLRQKLEQSEIKGGAQSQEKKPAGAERQSEQSPATGTPQANFDSAFELVADSVYLRTGGESGPIVNNPVAGQQYFIHFDWRNTGDTAVNFRIEIKLNGEVFCAYNSGTIPGNSPSTTYCTTPVTWLAGSNTIEGVLDVNNVISETNENNNRKRRIYPLPGNYELVAGRMYLRTGGESGPEVDNPVAGQQYFIHFDWRNAGITASYFRIEIKLNGNVFCAYNNSGIIPGNSPSTTYCTSPIMWPAGENKIEGILDASDLIPEGNENNNGVSRTFPATPVAARNLAFDFNKTTWSFNSSTQVLSLTTRVINNGTETVGASELGYYLSTNATINTSDFLIGTDPVESLAPNGFSDESFSADLCKINGLTTPGTYFIGWYADHTSLISESNENDNTAVSTSSGSPASIVVTCPVASPNLTFDFNNTTWNYNSSTRLLSLTARVINNGSANAGNSELGYYLSINATITTSDFLIDTDAVGSLSPGGFSDESFSADLCKIYGLTTPGTYFIGWFCDHTFKIAESNENDNTAVSTSSGSPASISVMCAPLLPNLVIDPSSSGNFNPATCDLHLNAKVCNTGNANAGPSKVGYFLSTDAIISTSDCRVGDDGTPALVPGACSVFTPTLSLRHATCISMPGTYFFGMIADYLYAVTESSESDNDAVFKPALNLTCPPPCVVVGRVECPSSVQKAAQFTSTIFVNMGGCPAPNNRLGRFTGSLKWDPTVLQLSSHSGLKSGFTGVVVTSGSNSGHLSFNGTNSNGAAGDVNILDVIFMAIGPVGATTTVDLNFSVMAAAVTLNDLLPSLSVKDCKITVKQPPVQCNPNICSGPALFPTPRGGVLGQRLAARDKDTLYVDLRMKENARPVDAFGFVVNVNPSQLSFVRSVRGNLTTSFNAVNANETPNRSGRVTCGGFGTTPIPANRNGVLLTLAFVVKCQAGDSSLVTISNLTDDVAGFNACCNVFRCARCVEDGDITGDGRLTPGDALCAFQIFLGGGTLPSSCNVPGFTCELDAADVNCDGTVTPGDALAIFNRFISGLPPTRCLAKSALAKATSTVEPYQLELQQQTLTPAPGHNEMLKITLVVDNPAGLNAFGLQLTYPSHKLDFLGVERTTLTACWTQLRGQANQPGVLTVGGFNQAALTAKAPGELLEIVFAIKGQLTAPDEIMLSHLTDDFKHAVLKTSGLSAAHTASTPKVFKLYQNYPNPLRAGVAQNETLIRFDLPGQEAVSVELVIYNLYGQVVRRLVSGKRSPGAHEVTWDGKDEVGRVAASGTYLYRLKTAAYFETKRLTVVR